MCTEYMHTIYTYVNSQFLLLLQKFFVIIQALHVDLLIETVIFSLQYDYNEISLTITRFFKI